MLGQPYLVEVQKYGEIVQYIFFALLNFLIRLVLETGIDRKVMLP